jgi:flagellar motor switch protein FliN
MSSSPILLSSSDLPVRLTAPGSAPAPSEPFAALQDVPCVVDVVLGTGRITVRECLKLQRHSVIRLNQAAGSDLDVRVQGISVALGEAVIVDESTAVRVSSILPPPGTGGRQR